MDSRLYELHGFADEGEKLMGKHRNGKKIFG